MRRYTIEVDQEVFAYLDAEANHRLETHNTVLRRKLSFSLQVSLPARRSTGASAPPATTGLPDLPPRTPAALEQILSVVHLVRANGRTRSEATGDVAKRMGVTPQTVNDKYGRQLGLTADRFDVLLDDQSLRELELLLKTRFPGHSETVQRVLTALRPAPA